MSAKGRARKEFAKEQELEKLRNLRAERERSRELLKEREAAQQAEFDKATEGMTQEERKKFANKRARPKLIAVAVGIIVVSAIVVAVSSGGKDYDAKAIAEKSAQIATDTANKVDSAGESSCDHFRNVMSDWLNGILTDEELRAKIKQVDTTAYIATTPGIATGARTMLADVTQGNGDKFVADAASFANACATIGH